MSLLKFSSRNYFEHPQPLELWSKCFSTKYPMLFAISKRNRKMTSIWNTSQTACFNEGGSSAFLLLQTCSTPWQRDTTILLQQILGLWSCWDSNQTLRSKRPDLLINILEPLLKAAHEIGVSSCDTLSTSLCHPCKPDFFKEQRGTQNAEHQRKVSFCTNGHRSRSVAELVAAIMVLLSMSWKTILGTSCYVCYLFRKDLQNMIQIECDVLKSWLELWYARSSAAG